MKAITLSLIAWILSISAIAQITYVDKYSPKNKKRPVRSETKYIVLHTTEAGNGSSCNSVCRFGSCNYLVETDGKVYRVISHNKMAYHAGRSMWNGRTNLSSISVGIEIVGFHNKKPTSSQIKALKGLVFEIQKIYKLGDNAVLTHCMVAYGTPNEWFPYAHRGRKRCAMDLTLLELRKAMGLDYTFTVDPDVKAGRLKNADPYLAKFIYGGAKVSPKQEKPVKGVTEPDQENEESFDGFREIDGKGVWKIAGADYNKISTIYFFSDGRIRTGNRLSEQVLRSLPKDTKVLVGYVYGGNISKNRTAYQVVGKKWNLPSTFYRLPDQTIKSGDDMDDSKFPEGTIILFRR